MLTTILRAVTIVCGMAALTFVSQSSHPSAAQALFQARAEQDQHPAKGCNAATIRGSFGLILSGKATGYGDISGVGTVTLDGAGKYTGNTTGVLTAGGIGTAVSTPVNGTYTLKSDCSGTVVVNFVNLHLTVEGVTVFTNDGNDGHFVVTAPSAAQLTGTAQRL